MSVSGPATTLQAILSQIQVPAKPAAAARIAGGAPGAGAPQPAARPVAEVRPADVTQNAAANLNPNAPRGTYLNVVV